MELVTGSGESLRQRVTHRSDAEQLVDGILLGFTETRHGQPAYRWISTYDGGVTELAPTRRHWAVLLTLVCLVTFGSFRPSPAAADGHLVQIRFSAVTAPATGDGTVTMSGTVTNTSDEDLRQVQVMTWRYRSVVATTPDELRTVLTSPPDDPIGARITQFGPSFQDITTEDSPVLAPGESARFTVTVPYRDLQMDGGNGVYLLGVHVRGLTPGDGLATIARARTLLSRPPAGTGPTATVTSVVVLSSAPSAVGPNTFRDEHLVDELAPEGRLGRLLDSADRPGVSYAIDPALLAEITDMADGYSVGKPNGQSVDGTGQAAAQQWLKRFRSLDGDGWRLPWAMADLNALTTHPHREDLLASIHRTTERSVTDLPLLVTTPSGLVDADTITLSQDLQPKAVLAANFRSQHTVTASPTADIPLVRVEQGLFDGGPQPDPTADQVRIRDRRDAQTLVTAMDGRPQQVRLITTPQQAIADSDDPAWVDRQSLAELLARDAPQSSHEVEPVPLDAQIPTTTVDRVASYAQSCDALVDLVVASDTIRAQTDSTLVRSLSGWWVHQDGEATTMLQSLDPLIAPLRNGNAVTMAVAPKVTLTAQEGTFFPATITNRLSQPVRVQPVFRSEQPQRLGFPDQATVEIGPGQSVTVDIQPQTRVNGSVVATGRLRTVSGHPVSKPVEVTVESTNLGQAGWIIVIVSGAVLLGTTTWRIRQVRARAAGKQVEHEQ